MICFLKTTCVCHAMQERVEVSFYSAKNIEGWMIGTFALEVSPVTPYSTVSMWYSSSSHRTSLHPHNPHHQILKHLNLNQSNISDHGYRLNCILSKLELGAHYNLYQTQKSVHSYSKNNLKLKYEKQFFFKICLI